MLKKPKSAYPRFPKAHRIPALWQFIAAALVMSTQLVHAAAMFGVTSDTDVRADSIVSASNSTTLLAGGAGSPATDRAALFVFQLPNLGAVANPFTSAVFRFHLSSKTGTPQNIDLYGLGRRSGATVLAGDYYGQTTTLDASDATYLQNNILIPATSNGIVSTGSTATALKNYLNAQYAGGAGAGQYVFLRLSSDGAPAGVHRYNLTSADGGSVGATDSRPQILYNIPTGYVRPFIWVRDSEKAGILTKIASNAWATSVYNGMVSRVAADVSSHQSNRDTFLRGLPVVDWAAATPKFKTIPAYPESSVRYAAEAKFNDAQDCAILYYLTGDEKYARCAGDILHNVIKTLLPVAASTSTANGGWIFQDDLLKEARVTGPQMAIVYDFLHAWLQTNQVYDVKAAGMVNFNFTDAQGFFRNYYELTRDHGQKESNWSALMATTMLNNLLALDNATERNAAIQIYLTTGTSRQASLDYDYRNYTTTGNIWPESLQYAGEVGDVRSTHMVLLERVDPALSLFDNYPNLPLSLPRISYLRYPSDNEQISFGDGKRSGGSQPFPSYELVYQHAKERGRTDLTSLFGSLINGGVADGKYNRSSLRSYSSLSMREEPLQLLWQSASLSESSVTPALPRTDTLPFAGITLQRNLPPSGSSTNYGLMCFVGGAGHVHSHASGMSMEIYGMGEVMGAKSGVGTYTTALHENHYRLFAANNTVIVNGASRGEGGWENIAINTVQTVAMEPQPFASAVSPDYSFTCSSFADDKGTLAEGTQQRTMALIRTSPTSGYYVDVFRSKSTVTNRTATTLNGTVTNQYHDYIYRNIGETAVDLRADGATLPLTSQPNRFQNDIGDTYKQPGWRYFTNTTVSHPTSQSVKAQFVATIAGTPRYMSMHMPAVASREYAKVDSPPIIDAPSPYDTKDAPTLVVRQIGEAWNKAFATVYEPHYGSTGGKVQNVTHLLRSGAVVGVKVESTVNGKNLVQHVISNPDAAETYTDAAIGLSFTGRFGIASDNGDGTTTLYLGEGSSMSYRGNSVATANGASSQAEARFTPGQPPVVTSNTAVNVIAAGSAWVATADGSYLWNSAANWNPAVVPNGVGAYAFMNTSITGNQTVNLNSPVTLGELVVGDSSGAENTLLQKGTSGSLRFDQTGSAMAYLTRTAGGTGDVTFKDDLEITLNDNLTVRSAGGTAPSTMTIAGNLSSSGGGLAKEGNELTLIVSGNNSYTGTTTLAGGLLRLDNSDGLPGGIDNAAGAGESLLVFKGGVLGLYGDFTRQLGTGAGQLGWSPANNGGGSGGFAAFGADRQIRLNNGTGSFSWFSAIIGNGNTLILGHPTATHTLDFKNGINFSGEKRTVRVEDGQAAVDAILSGVLADFTTPPGSLNKAGPGVLSLANANTYNGTTTVADGVLRLQIAAALPSGNLELTGGGLLGLGAGNLTTRTLGTGINQIQWTGSGGFAAFGGDRIVSFGTPGTSIPWTAENCIGNGNMLILGHATADGTLIWDQALNLIDGSRTVQVNDGTAAIDAKISRFITGGSTLDANIFNKSGVGTLALTANNFYSGDTIVNAGTLMIGDGGTSGGVSDSSTNIIVASGATLAVNRSNTLTQGTANLITAISGGGGFAQVGSGTTGFMLPNVYTGPTTIASGTLKLGASGVLPDTSAVSIGSATLHTADGVAETTGTLAVTGAATINLATGAALAFANSSESHWTGGMLNLTGDFVSGSSLRFGTNGDGLTSSQLAFITLDGNAVHLALDADGFLIGGYAAWMTANAPNTGNNPNADEDGDGVANGIEYVIGGLTGTPDADKLPAIFTDGGTMLFTFKRDQKSIHASTHIEIQVGPELTEWPTTYAVADVAAANIPGVTVVKGVPSGFDTVTLSLPLSGMKEFARLKVTP
jgi:autotransporter-associated beta strand protein